MNEFQNDVIIILNKIRVQKNLPMIEFSKRLSDKCLNNCKLMSQADELFHVNQGKELECICYGFKNLYDIPEKLIKKWLDHEPHCKILLDKNMKYLGVNMSFDKNNKGIFFSIILE